jgi:hypothetical protein
LAAHPDYVDTLGMMVGRFIGPLLGKRAEILGGIVLIGIGAQILWAHFAGLTSRCQQWILKSVWQQTRLFR